MSGARNFTIEEDDDLLSFLFRSLPSHGRNKVKSFLKYGSVSVNGKVVSRHDHPLHSGDKVCVQLDQKAAAEKDFLRSLIDVVHEDETVVVVNKPEGLLTISTEKEQKETAYHRLNLYLNAARKTSEKKTFQREVRKQKEIFVVHRIDREVSGLLLFARKESDKLWLQENWKNFEKRYYAIVEGAPPKPEGTIESYLKENKFLNVFSSHKEIPGSKLALTHYRTLESAGKLSLLEIRLETGRKHQIRVHLAQELKTPIIGDDRYEAKTDPAGRLGLHAFYLAFEHPLSHEKMKFTLPLPGALRQVLKNEASSGTVKPSEGSASRPSR